MIEQTAIVAAEPQFDPLCKEAIAEDAINLPDLPKFWIGPDRASWRSDAVHVVAHWSYGALDKAKAAGQLYCDVNVRDRSAKATFIRNWNSPLAYPGKDQLAR